MGALGLDLVLEGADLLEEAVEEGEADVGLVDRGERGDLAANNPLGQRPHAVQLGDGNVGRTGLDVLERLADEKSAEIKEEREGKEREGRAVGKERFVKRFGGLFPSELAPGTRGM